MNTPSDNLAEENERLKRQLAEAQQRLARLESTGGGSPDQAKMEAVGRFAGGVAKDFNNFLIIAAGNAELLSREIDDLDARKQYVAEISRATDRCRAMVRRLLSFSRGRVANTARVDINTRLEALHGMFQTVVGDAVHVEAILDRRLPPVCVDPVQFEQMMMNLVVNARDAMDHGGELTIETDRVTVSRGASTLPAGAYVRIRVTDSGPGIPSDVQPMIFEPFFSTKAQSRGGGTGLGLAMVYGIVRQHGGEVTVSSAPGKGTTFDVRLPIEGKLSLVEPESDDDDTHSARRRTILYVEDEPQVRTLTCKQLERGGFNVLTAEDAESALALAAEHGDEIDVLVTDIMMPGMDGVEMAHRMVERLPGLPVLFVSGYASATLPDEGTLAAARFLPKPFTMRELLGAVRPLAEQSKTRVAVVS